jgi:hypothetical protein
MKNLIAALERSVPVALIACTALALTACAPTPTAPSLIPDQIGQQTRRDGLFSQPLNWEHTRPGCSGECPSVTLKSLIFPGVGSLTQLIDQQLAAMTSLGAENQPTYTSIAQFETYFWSAAGPRDETFLSAKIRYANKALTVLQLDSWQYYTGAAHGNSVTRFLTWHNTKHKTLQLSDILIQGRHDAYLAALQKVHEQWLLVQPDAKHDPTGYRRLWPFQPSDNAALTDAGLLVKYNSYDIAPYASGQPELLIPYPALKGIVRPEYLPASI